MPRRQPFHAGLLSAAVLAARPGSAVAGSFDPRQKVTDVEKPVVIAEEIEVANLVGVEW